VGHHVRRHGPGEPPGDFAGDSFSAFAGPAVLDVYLLSRLSRELWKVQGDWTGPVRQPKYARTIPDTLADVKPDNSFHLNLEYFDYCTGLRMTNGRFDALVGGRPRGPEEPLTQRHMDLAASVQVVLEEIMLRLTRALAAATS